MIRVDRKNVLRPAVFDRDAVTIELKRCRDLLPEKRSSFPFNVYKHPEIKDALARLFHGKCAYCESRYAHLQPMDVEHWRPKSLYWWLAARWENLLPSCIDCNRARRQIAIGETGEPTTDEKILLGKQDRFPLADEQQRASDIDEEKDEEPLLLNPCIDDPSQYIAINRMEDQPAIALGVICASGKAGERKRTIALESIRTYGLNRINLVQARAERRLLITERIYTVATLVRILQLLEKKRDKPGAGRSEAVIVLVDELICHEMTGLRRFMRPDRPFSAMARQIIQPFIDEITGNRADDGD